MDILKAKLESGIGRAEEYRWLGNNHPEGLNVHIEYIKDLVEPFVNFLRRLPTPIEEADSKLLEDAKKTLKNLQKEISSAREGVECPVIPKVWRQFLNVPLFDGSVAKFRNFMTTFSNMVHNDAASSNCEKLIILKDSLIGEASDFVDVFPTSATNYSLALKLLEDVYGSGSCELTRLYVRLNKVAQVSTTDGAKFVRTFWELESILQSMSGYGVDVNEDLCLKFLYLRKFSKKTLVTASVADSDVSLFEIRREMRYLVNVEELQLGSEDEADDEDGFASQPQVSQGRTNDHEVSAATSESELTAANRKDSSKPNESCEPSVAEKAENEPSTCVPTVCSNVTCVASGKETSVRLVLQIYAPVSLISEDAARRLGISVPSSKTLCLVTKCFHFTATEETFKLILQVGEERRVIHAHIVDDAFKFSDNVPAADVDHFLTEHPQLSHLTFANTGKGRPIDLFLSGSHFWDCMVPEEGRIKMLPVNNDRWRLQLTKFGWLLHGSADSGASANCSYWYPEKYISL